MGTEYKDWYEQQPKGRFISTIEAFEGGLAVGRAAGRAQGIKYAENATAKECAKISKINADGWQTHMNCYPSGDYKVEVYEKAMVACEHISRAIKEKFGLEI
jgi:hypothetical protein